MATLQELERALVNADKAGDMDAARRLAAAVTAARQDTANKIPGTQVPSTIQQPPEPGILDQVVGAGETALTLATGATGGSMGMLGGAAGGLAQQILSGQFGTPQAMQAVQESAMKGAQALTYAPRTQAGQGQVQAIGEVLQNVPPVIPVVGPIGAVGQSLRNVAPLAQATAARGVAAAAPTVQRATQAVREAPAAMSGAIGRAVVGESGLPPGETAATARAGSIGAAATPIELQRAAEAEMAGLKLTEGEMKRSPQLLAWEKEKAKAPEYQAPFMARQQENNRIALQKFDQLLDDTGAEVSGSGIDFGNTGIAVVDALMKGWSAEKAKTSALYNAFRASPEHDLPVDHTGVLQFIDSQARNIPNVTGISDLARQNAVRLGLAMDGPDGNLIPVPTTLGKLEEFRQSMNAASAMSPNDKRLLSIIKREIDLSGEPVGGDLTKAMRAQRARQAAKYENRAIVSRLLLDKRGGDDPVTPVEEVFRKTILNAKPSEIQHIRRVLATGGDDGKQAWKELQGATVRYIAKQSESGLGSDNLPVISAANMNKAIKQLDVNGKLDMVLGKPAAEQVRNLNQVLQYIQSTPPGTSINNSGTARTLMGLMAEAGLVGAATGVPLPVAQGLKMLRDNVKDKRIKARITQALNYTPNTTQVP